MVIKSKVYRKHNSGSHIKLSLPISEVFIGHKLHLELKNLFIAL